MQILNTKIELLQGVGSKIYDNLKKINCYYFRDLLLHIPMRYEERIFMPDFLEINQKVILKASVISEKKIKNKLNIYTVKYKNYLIDLIFFNEPNYITNFLHINKEIGVIGELSKDFINWKIIHPNIINAAKLNLVPRIFPIYHLTKGLTNNLIYKLVAQIIDRIDEEPLYLKEILKQIHINGSEEAILKLVKYEYLIYHLKILEIKNLRNKRENNELHNLGNLINKFKEKLPFILTKGQEDAIKIILKDISSKYQMSRLLQGDVGCGKTIVAFIAMIYVIESGYQSVLMAPTELLAAQHYENMKKLCNFLDLKIALLTGSIKKNEKKIIYNLLNNGEIDIIIGTHALIQDDVKFKNLRLVVIDEQHRFGVNQRKKLSEKSEYPDILYMSATPIPRTMALTIYGDMEITEIKEKPASRKDIITISKSLNDEKSVINAIIRVIEKGEKIYWICPLIEENEELSLSNVNQVYEKLSNLFRGKVGILHGNINNKEKDEIMQKFVSSKLQILVATTVVEVGIDVKDATIIIIDQAERFGLAQLHQLRGRVGRGDKQSYCILLHSNKLSEYGKKRINIMKKTNDGFIIAEEDMKLRGAGDIFGTSQSGLPIFKTGNLEQYFDIFLESHKQALEIYNSEKLNKYLPLFELFNF